MKKKVSIKLIGFIIAVLSLFVVIAGFANLTGYHVNLFGNKATVNYDAGTYTRFPLGLFIIYVGMILEVIGSCLFAAGYKFDPPTGSKTSSSKLAIRAFSFIPIILGLFTLIGGLISDVTGEKLVLLNMELKVFLAILGAVIMVVFGLIWWFCGISRSEEKTCILLLGSSRTAKFLRDYRSEIKKIVWPSRKATLKQTGVVLVSLLTVALVIGLLDFGFLKLIELLTWLTTKI